MREIRRENAYFPVQRATVCAASGGLFSADHDNMQSVREQRHLQQLLGSNTLTIQTEAKIFGTVVATIVCAGIVWALRRVADTWSLPTFLALCAAIGVCMLLLAWWLDRRASARAKRERYDRS